MSDIENKTTSASSAPKSWSPKLFPSLVACITGSILGLILVQCFDPYFKFADIPDLGISPPPELIKKYNDAQIEFWSYNYSLNFGVLGLCIGVLIGLVATGVRRIPSMLAGGLGGLLGGSASGYLIGVFGAKSLIASANQSLVESAGMHFALWSAIFGLVLLFIGLVQDGPIRAAGYLLLGIIVGLAVAVVYNILSSIVFANANLLKLIPESKSERIVWILACSIILGLGLHLGLRDKNPTDAVPNSS